MDVQGLRCVVTGSASGIGDAVARRLAHDGASVISVDRNEPSTPVEQHITVDLADPGSIAAAVDRIEGRIDVLANVAGVPGTLPDETVLRVNFLGMRMLTDALLERFNEGGSIVVVASTAGLMWNVRLEQLKDLVATSSFEEGLEWYREHAPSGSAYTLSKEAAIVYVMGMGGAVRGINDLRMNAVLPGPVETPILPDFERSMGAGALDAVKTFLGRHATPDEVAAPITFLASRDSRWINGTSLIADGGISGAVLGGFVPAPTL